MFDVRPLKKRWKLMKTCKDCHFLVKVHTEPSGIKRNLHWDPKELEKGQVIDYDGAGCYKGVWWKGREKSLEYYLKQPRSEKGGCFFFPRQEGMEFPAAVELEAQKKQAKIETERFRRNLLIAILAVVIGAVLAYLL